MKTEYKIGDRRGCLEIFSEPFKIEKRRIYYDVKCDCGNVFQMRKGNFESAFGKYCPKCHSQYLTFHTKETKRIFKIFAGMKNRCYTKHNPSYANYGGRGIKICQEWIDSVQSFCDWSLANGYSNELSIDRIDVNGNYEPSNCRWATIEEQAANRRDSVYFELFGEKKPLKYFAELFNINPVTVCSRIKSGLTVEESFKKPVRYSKRKSTA